MINKYKQRGMALVSALMVLVILAIIAGCFAIVMNRDARQSRISSYQIICLNAAQAGLDYAMWLHKHNLALYPVFDYSQLDSPDNALPMTTAKNSDMDVFPAKGSVYNLPMAGLVAHNSTTKYDPVLDSARTGITNVYNNQLSDTKYLDTEYMFVNDLSFYSGDPKDFDQDKVYDNFMRQGANVYCVTFQIREQIDATGTLHLVSTGKLRYIPEGYDLSTSDGWLEFLEKLSDGTTGNLSSKRLDALGFTEYASRTISANYNFKTNDFNSNYPGSVTGGLDSDLPDNRQFQMPERSKREWFR